jgi:hypothetical protein
LWHFAISLLAVTSILELPTTAFSSTTIKSLVLQDDFIVGDIMNQLKSLDGIFKQVAVKGPTHIGREFVRLWRKWGNTLDFYSWVFFGVAPFKFTFELCLAWLWVWIDASQVAPFLQTWLIA